MLPAKLFLGQSSFGPRQTVTCKKRKIAKKTKEMKVG